MSTAGGLEGEIGCGGFIQLALTDAVCSSSSSHNFLLPLFLSPINSCDFSPALSKVLFLLSKGLIFGVDENRVGGGAGLLGGLVAGVCCPNVNGAGPGGPGGKLKLGAGVEAMGAGSSSTGNARGSLSYCYSRLKDIACP